jgi:hypothetical protein
MRSASAATSSSRVHTMMPACDDTSVCSEDVVAKLTQALDHGRTEILIGIELGHRLRFRRLLDGLLNLLTMGGIVVPGGCQIRQR